MSVPRMSRTIAIVVAGIVSATVASAQEPAAVVAWQTPAAAAQAGKPGVPITTPKPGWPGATYGFSVVLVLGDMQGGATADNVPAAARKALTDLKDFLPYKSYRLLDSAWVLGSGNVSTRLRGVDDQEYNLNLSGGASREEPKTLHISFQLRDADSGKPNTAADAESAIQKEKSGALDALPPRRRAVLVMYELEGATISAIAGLLGVTPVTVRWHLSRGRRDMVKMNGSRRGDES